MDTTTFAPFRASLHQASEQFLALSKQGAELYATQSRLAASQIAGSLDTWQQVVTAQQQAAFAAGQIVVDALKPAAA